MRGAAGRPGAAAQVQRPRDRCHHGHAAAEDAAAPRRQRSAVNAARNQHQPLGRRDLPARHHQARRSGSRPTSRSSKAATTTAPFVWCRTRAATSACAPSPTSSPMSATPSRPAARRFSCSDRSSITIRRPTTRRCDFAQLLADVNDVAGVERIRFASPHPRHTGARLIEAVRDLPESLQTPAPARPIGLDHGAPGDAAAAHARGISGSRRQDPRVHSRRHTLYGRDRRVPG